MTFETEKYVLIKNAVSKETCKVMAEEFRLLKNFFTIANPSDNYNDDLVTEKTFSWYSPFCFEALSNSLILPIVENVVKEELWSTYSYARIYYNGSQMRRHVDRSASEYSVTMCVDVDPNHKWNIGIQTVTGEEVYVDQSPGDIIVYRGNELFHWRDPYPGTEQINAFFFYVRKNGNRSELKYDTRPALGMGTSSRTLNSEEQFKKYRYS
jgi:hypothetical protein